MSEIKEMYKKIQGEIFPEEMTILFGDNKLVYRKKIWEVGGELRGLRYGENPDQPAALYEHISGGIDFGGISWRGPGQGLVSSVTEAHMLQAGKHPGKTNFTDVDNGVNIMQYLEARPAAVILKHNNPCGAAWDKGGVAEAIKKAIAGDRIAAFGGAVVVNSPLTLDAAEQIAENYFEVVAAPDFEEKALDTIKKRKNLRILRLPGLAALGKMRGASFMDIKSLCDGGLIVQKSFVNRILSAEDFIPATATSSDGLSVSARSPSKTEAEDLLFAWAVESGVISNSVIFAKNGATVAIGAGEQDRVGCVELAIYKAYAKYADALAFAEQGLSLYELRHKAQADAEAGEKLADITARAQKAKGGLAGSVLVSDGFFPFRDGADTAIAQGITAIAQPGGSLRDHEVIMACNEASPQVAMVFTGQRSFKH